MKKEEKDYAGLFLKIFGITILLYFVISIISALTNTNELWKLSIIAMHLAVVCFFISVIDYQFKDKKVIWGIISVVLTLISIEVSISTIFSLYGGTEKTSYAPLINILSCLLYYFIYIRPKFRKKKKV